MGGLAYAHSVFVGAHYGGRLSVDSHRDHMLVEPSFAPEQFWI
jgi:hypothetical protein